MEPPKTSLKSLYYDILLHIADEMTKEDKEKLKFWLHRDLPKRTLENPQLLDWFTKLERKGKIGSDNLRYLEDFLKHSGLKALLKDVEKYKIERALMLRSAKKTTKAKTVAMEKGTRMKWEPSNIYYKILLHIADNMTKEDQDKFKLWSHLHSDLPKRILENPQPLEWFTELDRRGMIGPGNLLYLEEFLKHSGLKALFKDVVSMMKKKMAKDKTCKQKGTRIKSRVVEERKNRDRGKAFVSFEDGITALLENSSLRERERESLAWNINKMAYQLFGHSVDQSHRPKNSSNSQCSSGGNPSIKCSNSQCSSCGNPSIKCSNSQCSSGGNPSMDIKIISSSMESLHQRTSHSMVRSVFGYIVLGLGTFTLSAAFNLWLVV